jgi:hypothetical protein
LSDSWREILTRFSPSIATLLLGLDDPSTCLFLLLDFSSRSAILLIEVCSLGSGAVPSPKFKIFEVVVGV